MNRFATFFGFFWLIAGSLLAQSLTKQAARQFDQLSFAQAAELYEQALKDPAALPNAERRSALARLGYSYQKLHDTPNAERVYRSLIESGDPATDYPDSYLYYAQALASNGKYREAQAAYDRYANLSTVDKSKSGFSKLSHDASPLTRKAGNYRIEFLAMNTRQPEFSPTYYKDGLVFVSSGHGTNGAKRPFKLKNASFLDLYYVPDQKSLRSDKASTRDRARAKKLAGASDVRPLSSGDLTASTANDSRTVGFFGGNTLGMGYGEKPVSESEQFARSLNTKYHEGPVTFTHDGSQIIFTRNNYNNGDYRKSKDGVNKLKLYTAHQVNGTWSEAEELPFNSDEYSTGHPALSKDDQLLYFSSDRPGGMGGTDIYVSRRVNGKWGEPVNLGKQVNTKGNDLFPFIDEKGNLYFASDGHSGLGGLDMFYAQLTPDGKQATALRNLGEPLNSPQDDFGIVTDGERVSGYFSSNRKNGGSDDDVYRFTREGSVYPCRELIVSLIDAESKAPLANVSLAVDNPASDRQEVLKTDAEGLVRLCLKTNNDVTMLAVMPGYLDNQVGFSTKNLSDVKPSRLEILMTRPREPEKPATTALRGRVLTQTGHKPIAGAKVVLINECDGALQETITGPDGKYAFTVKPGCEYAIEAIKQNMGTAGSRVAKDGSGDTDLFMFRKGDVIRIDNVYYDLDKATLRSEATVELDKVAALMSKYPAMRVELRSHTDSRAKAAYNKILSTNRAKTVVAYLKTKGIAPGRLTAKGYGESLPLNRCRDGVKCTEEEHQRNRRTEIRVLNLQ